MNHRERILAAIRHQPLDRVPTDMWATPEVLHKLFAHFGIAVELQRGADTIWKNHRGVGLLSGGADVR